VPAQVRFEVGYYSLKPDIKVIAPWREWDLNSRTKLIAYAGAQQASRGLQEQGDERSQGLCLHGALLLGSGQCVLHLDALHTRMHAYVLGYIWCAAILAVSA
jgi:hypothetical protein